MTATPPPWYPPPTVGQPPRISDRAFLAVAAVALLLAAAVGVAGLAYFLGHRPAVARSQGDPMAQTLREMGVPQGFTLLNTAPYHGMLTAHYQVNCDGTDGACPVDVPRAVADWARSAGDPGVTAGDIQVTLIQQWTSTFPRDGMSVHLVLSTDFTNQYQYPWYTLEVDVSAT